MGELKGESLDRLRLCNKFEEELKMISSSLSVSGPAAQEQVLAEFRSLQQRIDNTGLPAFADCLNLSVGSVPPGSMPFAEEMTDSIFLRTPSFSGKSFMLVIPERSPQFDRSNLDFNPKVLEVQIHGPNMFHYEFLLKSLMLTVSSQGLDSMGTYILEESSIFSKLEKKEGVVVDGKIVKFFLKRPSSICKISVKLLRSNISNSPLAYQFLNEAGSEQTTRENLTVN